MNKLQVIIASTRPERKGAAVGRWFHEIAQSSDTFDVELVDLREVDLPVFDEPRHPRLQDYEHQHTREWAESVARADAYVVVTPEYNHGPPPSLLNALDYVYLEWNYKPVAFVNYGGVSGGTRSADMVKQTMTTLKMMPIPEAVSIPFFSQHIDEASGEFDPGEVQEDAAADMLAELARWADALKPMRE